MMASVKQYSWYRAPEKTNPTTQCRLEPMEAPSYESSLKSMQNQAQTQNRDFLGYWVLTDLAPRTQKT